MSSLDTAPMPAVAPNSLEAQDREQLLGTARRLLAEAQALSTRISAVNEIATAINRSLHLDEILAVVRRQAKWLLDFNHLSVCLPASDELWQLITLFGPESEVVRLDTLADASPLAQGLRSGQAQLLDARSAVPHLSAYPAQMVIPLQSEQEVLGAILFAAHAPTRYHVEDMRIAYLLALQVAAAIRNARRFREMQQLYGRLADAKRESDALLLNVLPEQVAEELKGSGRVEPVQYEAATVMFTDFEGFTTLSRTLSPQALIGELDHCFSAFDTIVMRHGLEKLKTVGDGYMAVAGVPVPSASHALDAVAAAQEILAFLELWRAERLAQGLPSWRIRIGLHSGPIVAGVIGHHKFAYDVWGTTVNVAARLQEMGAAGRINLSRDTYALLNGAVPCEPRGQIAVKNHPAVEMFFVSNSAEAER